jgi:hypothetical protein
VVSVSWTLSRDVSTEVTVSTNGRSRGGFVSVGVVLSITGSFVTVGFMLAAGGVSFRVGSVRRGRPPRPKPPPLVLLPSRCPGRPPRCWLRVETIFLVVTFYT